MKQELTKLMNCNRNQKTELSTARERSARLEKELNAAEQEIVKINTSRKVAELEARKMKELLDKYKYDLGDLS